MAGETFSVTGRQTISEGWRAVVAIDNTRDVQEHREGADEEDASQSLPALREGDAVTCDALAIAEKRTEPPRRFTEATLVQAMTGIARFVDDPHIKQLLRETDGIGTPATQAQIIETLFGRGFIERRGRQVLSTQVGRALIQSLPEIATRPDMTALWEAAMRRISEGEMPLDAFLGAVLAQLRDLVAAGRALGALRVPLQPGRQAEGRTSSPSRRPRRRRGHRSKIAADVAE